MLTLLAALPVVVVVVLLALRVAPLTAALAGTAVVLVLVATVFGGRADGLLAGALGWLPTVLEVVLIVGGGILLARLMDRSGAQAVLAGWLGRLTAGPVATALLVVHGVTPFAESVTGFGVGVLVGVPLLAAAGFSPHRAAVLGLLGLCAVPWGALGPGNIVAARLIGATPEAVGTATAWPNVVVTVSVGVAAVLMVPGGRSGRAILAATASGLVLWAGVLASSVLLGMAPSGALGALLTVAAHLAWRRSRGVHVGAPREVRSALGPYAVLLTGILLSTVAVQVLDLDGGWSVVASPALWLGVTCLVAVPSLGLGRAEAGVVLREAAALWGHTGPATAAFLGLGVLMVLGGLTAQLGDAVTATGDLAFVAGPVLGALGGFVTGSSVAANSMFAAAQGAVATGLGVSPVAFVGVQNAAASLLTMASPARVLLAVRAVPSGSVDLLRVTRTVLVVDVVLVALLCAWNVVLL